MWADVAHLFSDTYHVIFPDLRGYGQSGKPDGYENYTFRNMANDVIPILKSLNTEKKPILSVMTGAREMHKG